ncbi:PIN domain-containing protein [Litoribacter populi]|uniref:PIN domain-containing protein n=1 Tax=Litoribacter populi TaxID=2598460 RepID=UPI00117D10B5|nr:PIN domain-containing protein [Litoribacter populi]
MKALLDTNIIIHREAGRVANQDIGILFKWLDKVKYQKCIHLVTIQEIEKNPNTGTVDTFKIKMDSYEQLLTTAKMKDEVRSVSERFDENENDRNDTVLLNEVFVGRVDILISEDKKIHSKANALGISDQIFTINSFLEKVFAEFPELVKYQVLGVQQKLFGELDINDPFFDTLKEDYPGFERWFHKKANENAYVTINSGSNRLLSFLYIKTEERDEAYPDINPVLKPKKRLKVGTFKVISNGVRLGERFMKIIFDNALARKVDEIYVTIFEKRDEQQRLIALLEEWGFYKHGTKGGDGELIFVRDFTPQANSENPKLTFPYLSSDQNVFLIPIYPDYHTELLPDSYLKTESPQNFIEHEPHRNALSKVYICRSIERGIQKGDIIIFYRTAEKGKSAYYSSVITTIAICEEVIEDIEDENEFIARCRKRSVFSNEGLKEFWNWNPRFRPFIINFLYVWSFGLGNRMNRKMLLERGILSGAENEIRGLKKITPEQFKIIVNETGTNESLIVD